MSLRSSLDRMRPSRTPAWVGLSFAAAGVGLILLDPLIRYAQQWGWPLTLILAATSALVFAGAFGPTNSRYR